MLLLAVRCSSRFARSRSRDVPHGVTLNTALEVLRNWCRPNLIKGADTDDCGAPSTLYKRKKKKIRDQNAIVFWLASVTRIKFCLNSVYSKRPARHHDGITRYHCEFVFSFASTKLYVNWERFLTTVLKGVLKGGEDRPGKFESSAPIVQGQ